MELFWKAIGAALITLVLSFFLEQQSKSYGMLLILAGCGILAMTAATFLQPTFHTLQQLVEISGNDNSTQLPILIKILGIGITGEIASSICSDGGYSALGKGIQFVAKTVIISLSMPIFTSVLELIRQLLSQA